MGDNVINPPTVPRTSGDIRRARTQAEKERERAEAMGRGAVYQPYAQRAIDELCCTQPGFTQNYYNECCRMSPVECDVICQNLDEAISTADPNSNGLNNPMKIVYAMSAKSGRSLEECRRYCEQRWNTLQAQAPQGQAPKGRQQDDCRECGTAPGAQRAR